MSRALRALRRRILTPNRSETSLDKRGFHKKSPAAQELLETVGGRFLDGYAHAVYAPEDAAKSLERIPVQFRGFAYEGAAMGFAMLDALPVARGGHVARFLAGQGHPHVYMAYIGIGWAMARLPRFRRPELTSLDPLLRWLVLDGYGFHQAYFRTERYVRCHHEDIGFRWPEHPGYVRRAIDQGIGRALWFVGGTDVDLVAGLIDGFPADRRADLYSGAGLAATYAGGADEDELRAFWEHAGEHRGAVAQGSAFAAEARVRAGLDVPHTAVATRVFCSMSPVEAAQITRIVRPVPPVRGELPAYEVWRQRVANEFVSLRRCQP